MATKLPPLISKRLKALRREIKSHGAQALYVTDMSNVRYLSGFTGSEASLIIKSGGQYLLTDSRYTTQAASQAAGYKVVKITRKADDFAKQIGGFKIGRLAFEPGGMTHARFLEMKKALKGVKLIPFNDSIMTLRRVKDDSEVKLIKKAADIAAGALKDVLPLIKPGLCERDLAIVLETRMRELGSEKAAFDTIVASGPRGALPHGIATDRKIRKNELVTIDFGAIYKGYQSDQTVTLCVGKASKKKKDVYDTVLEAQRLAIDLIKPGAVCAEVDAAARDYIRDKGYGDYFGHGLGHGVGLDTHEEPTLAPGVKTVLEPGMVVTVEPGIYIPGDCGVRIEDMALVTQKGCRLLSGSGVALREL